RGARPPSSPLFPYTTLFRSVEANAGVARGEHPRIERELRAIGAGFPHTARIDAFLFHPGFPVDIRHNAKIDREALAAWATQRSQDRKSTRLNSSHVKISYAV